VPRGNADARIGHGKFDQGAVGSLLAPSHLNHHLALLGKLERIAGQIDEDLTQAAGSPRRAVGTSACRRQPNSRPLRCAGSAKRSKASSTVVRRSKSIVPTSNRPASIFEKVQDVVDDVEQGFTGPPHGIGVVTLFKSQMRFEQESVIPMMPFMGYEFHGS